MVLAFASSCRYNTRRSVNVSTRAPSRAWVDVDLAGLLANARAIQRAAPGSRLLPMVKADAYGLGAGRVVRSLETLDPWGYGVATVEEGAALRRLGVTRPIIVFTPAREDLLHQYADHDLRAVLDDPDVIRAWSLPYHLEVDTGMGRAGINWSARGRLQEVQTNPPEGVFTHFHSADAAPGTVQEQLQRFREALDVFETRPALVHAANSAAALRQVTDFALVRPGIYLYGGRVGHDVPPPVPVVSVRARVVSVRGIRSGETVSYGAEWSAPSDTTVATLGIGYADGVLRAVQGRGFVLLRGVRCPVVGRVTMDMTMVEVGRDRVPGDPVRPGEVATLIGDDGVEEVTVDEFADWAGTISYEVLVRLGARLPRRYHEG
jgi:alanine racemase